MRLDATPTEGDKGDEMGVVKREGKSSDGREQINAKRARGAVKRRKKGDQQWAKRVTLTEEAAK